MVWLVTLFGRHIGTPSISNMAAFLFPPLLSLPSLPPFLSVTYNKQTNKTTKKSVSYILLKEI